MSAETITTALFLITAVVAAGVLINAVYPIVFNMAGTFSSTTHQSDVRIRTDFKIITTFASTSAGTAQVWMKNTGSEPISLDEIKRSDVFCGEVGNFDRLAYQNVTPDILENDKWTETFDSGYDLNNNQFWDPGETLKVTAKTTIPPTGSRIYFQFATPSGIWRSNEFTVS
ncbi:MAG: flagellin [Methanoregula sp.]|jgi:flagellar protein FlaG|nr:flagellin [Methanoregula sp.]